MDPDWVDSRTEDRESPSRAVGLRMAVVEYAHQPDRCTVYQAEETSTPLTSTWMSVDTSIVESLASRR